MARNVSKLLFFLFSTADRIRNEPLDDDDVTCVESPWRSPFVPPLRSSTHVSVVCAEKSRPLDETTAELVSYAHTHTLKREKERECP
jgi:hypothetical protein